MRDIIDAIHLRPKQCVWEVTARCNMRCLHCASDLGEQRPRRTELPLDVARRVCHELKDLACEHVVLSGGEAILRDDWDAIALELVGLGISVSLISNGLAIDERTAERIVRAGVCRVALSLDGLEATHNHIRCNPRSFERVGQAFRLLKDRGLQVNIVTHVNRLNLAELPHVERFVASLGADVWRVQLGSPLGRLSATVRVLVRLLGRMPHGGHRGQWQRQGMPVAPVRPIRRGQSPARIAAPDLC